jgi:4'-phosphopantetheinyl transferase
MTTEANRALLEAIGADLQTRPAVLLATALPTSQLPAESTEILRAQLDDVDLKRFSEIQAGGGAIAFLVSRAIVRAVLGGLLGRPAKEVELLASERGKPGLARSPDPPLYFNASHSRTHILVALSRVGDLGVDVEDTGAVDERVIRRSLSDEEYERLAHLDGDERAAAFLRLWTVKEACAKATGVGIGIGMRTVVATLDGSGRWRDYLWESLDLGPGLAAALAIRRPEALAEGPSISLYRHTLNALFGIDPGFAPEGPG